MIHTGYNNGFQKGTFATQFDRKEYFEKFIRPKNKELYGAKAKDYLEQRNNASFIVHKKGQKEEFNEAVKRHLKALDEAEGIRSPPIENELPQIHDQSERSRPNLNI